MNTPLYKNSKIYLYQDYQELQDINNEIIKRKAERMEEMIEKIFTGIAYVILFITGVVGAAFLSVMVGN